MLDNKNPQNEEGSKILDNPRIKAHEELLESQKPKKGSWWLFKLVLIVAIIALLFYLFMHPQKIQEFVNQFFEKLLKN